VNAEDPVSFAPHPDYHRLQPPAAGVRIDSALTSSTGCCPITTPIGGKLTSTRTAGPARSGAWPRAEEYIVEGHQDEYPFHKKLLDVRAVVQGRYDTRLVENYWLTTQLIAARNPRS